MLYYSTDNLTSTECSAIIHGCNCAGKMGSGVALAIRNKFPDAYEAYMNTREYHLGFIILAESNGKTIGNLLTQESYGYDGKRYAHPIAITNALHEFCLYWIKKNNYNLLGLPPIASPKIGCGLGGLSWSEDVEPIFSGISELYGIDFWIYDNNIESINQ